MQGGRKGKVRKGKGRDIHTYIHTYTHTKGQTESMYKFWNRCECVLRWLCGKFNSQKRHTETRYSRRYTRTRHDSLLFKVTDLFLACFSFCDRYD